MLKAAFSTINYYKDHATFREKGAKLACVDKLGDFLSLTLFNKAILNRGSKLALLYT